MSSLNIKKDSDLGMWLVIGNTNSRRLSINEAFYDKNSALAFKKSLENEDLNLKYNQFILRK